jgi:hypothetical protein
LVVTGIVLAVDVDVDLDVMKRWGVPLLTAAFVFAKTLEDYWRIGARRRRFWTTLGVLGAAHFLLFLFVLPDPWRRNPVVIFTVGVPELLVVYFVLARVLGRAPWSAPHTEETSGPERYLD